MITSHQAGLAEYIRELYRTCKETVRAYRYRKAVFYLSSITTAGIIYALTAEFSSEAR